MGFQGSKRYNMLYVIHGLPLILVCNGMVLGWDRSCIEQAACGPIQ